tara:strand:+ start:6841 stop:7071 length:231 start_codon:yes stop_codon:yes gene_type:complete
MENIYLTGLIISFTFFVAKFIEMRFILKENKPFKSVVIDTIFVYFSVIIGYFFIEQFTLKTKTLTEAPVFVNGPGF